mmetsp:Transcript_2492/g.9860  ORF Transcript_2492/g.9860 Transcript_2492/m.9860 type:complete len:420 (-) Transcript_2492:172-1431(-)
MASTHPTAAAAPPRASHPCQAAVRHARSRRRSRCGPARGLAGGSGAHVLSPSAPPAPVAVSTDEAPRDDEPSRATSLLEALLRGWLSNRHTSPLSLSASLSLGRPFTVPRLARPVRWLLSCGSPLLWRSPRPQQRPALLSRQQTGPPASSSSLRSVCPPPSRRCMRRLVSNSSTDAATADHGSASSSDVATPCSATITAVPNPRQMSAPSPNLCSHPIDAPAASHTHIAAWPRNTPRHAHRVRRAARSDSGDPFPSAVPEKRIASSAPSRTARPQHERRATTWSSCRRRITASIPAMLSASSFWGCRSSGWDEPPSLAPPALGVPGLHIPDAARECTRRSAAARVWAGERGVACGAAASASRSRPAACATSAVLSGGGSRSGRDISPTGDAGLGRLPCRLGGSSPYSTDERAYGASARP